MSIKIQGKPLKEWVEEQKKKDGVMIVHRGTTRNGYSTSTYNGAIVTVQDDKDIRYENADISLRINGKEYRLTGNLVERKSGIWYVDGSIVDLPEQEQSRDMADGIKEVERKVTDALNESAQEMLDVFGIANIDCHVVNRKGNPKGTIDIVNEVVDHSENVYGGRKTTRKVNIKNDFTGGETIIHGAGTRTITTGKRTVIKGGSVNIRRGDKTYTIKGDTIEKVDGRWYADGKAVDWDSIGGEYTESNVISIEINGDVQNLATTSGDVTVNGNVQNLRTGSGDVECEDAVNVNTGSGDVHCKNITGMVSTGSGDIYHG